MTPSPLSQSRKITQDTLGPEPFQGWVWLIVVHQWAGVLGWGLALLTASAGDSLLVFWMASVLLMLWGGNCWLMHKRRTAFIWVLLVQTFFEFGIWVLAAEKDSEIYGAAIGSLILGSYAFLGFRPSQTFTRTMEEPTR